MNKTDRKVYEFIIQFKKDNDGNSPSVREIQDNLEEVSSTGHAFYSLVNLEDAGLIIRNHHSSRGITVVGGKWVAPDLPATKIRI